MKTETRKLLKLYYDSRSACQVLGYLMINPLMIKNTSYPLDVEDFSVGRHTWLYKAIYNLAMKGATSLSLTDVESYIANVSPLTHKKFFEDSNGVEWINEIINDVKEDNFDYYYSTLRKYSLLRSYIQQGIDVKDILNKEELNGTILEEQLANFDNLTIEDIIHCFDRRNLDSKQRFAIREDNKSRKSGEGAEELFNVMKQSPSYGYGLESNYLNAITYGAVGGRFLLESRDSGCGKTRNALKRLIGICSPYIWSFEANDFIPNPNGQHNKGLYIGTEMDLYTEIEPTTWCVIAGVDETKLKNNTLTTEEESRIKKAMEYAKQMELYEEDEENFDTNYLWHTIERYKVEHDITVVALDYIELNGALATEYVATHRGMTAREDQVLLELSKNIKSMAKKFNVFFIAYTQTNDEGRTQGFRDQTAVKGGKSLPNKADFGITAFEPTKKELELLEPLIEKNMTRGIGVKKIPNICYTIYKNRHFPIKDIKIWGVQDLGTGRFTDCFCTDKYYKWLDIEPITI